MHDVAVLDHVLLALDAQLACGLAASLAAQLHVIVVAGNFGLDEAAFKVGVDDAGGLGSLCANADGPSPDLHGTSGEVALQAKQLVCCLSKRLQAGVLKSQGLQVLCSLLWIKVSKLSLDTCADRDGLNAVNNRSRLGKHVLVDVCDVQDWLHGKQEEIAGSQALLVGHLHVSGAIALVQPLLKALCHVELGLEVLIALGLFLQLRQGALNGAQVSKDELRLDDVNVLVRIDATLNVNDVGIFEVTNNLADSIGVADVCQELIAQALALVCALDQASDVHKFNSCRHDTTRIDNLGQLLEPCVGHVNDAHVRVDGGKRIVCGQATLAGQRGEQRGFTNVWQANDTN